MLTFQKFVPDVLMKLLVLEIKMIEVTFDKSQLDT